MVERAVRIIWIVIGLVLMLVGLVGMFLPTHLLGVFMVLGLMLVLRNSRSARKRFVRMQRRYPRYVYPLRRLLKTPPQVWPVMWHELLRAERILPHRYRRLRLWRRRLRGDRIEPAPAAR